MSFCLPQFAADELLKRLQNGELTPKDMARLDSAGRREALSFLGEDATRVNALFESKLLLKNQEQGFKTWAKQVLGVGTPQYKDALSRIERLGGDIMKPSEQEAFLQDLISMRLNLDGVTLEESAKLLDLSEKVAAAKEQLPELTKQYIAKPGATKEYLKNETAGDMAQRLKYGQALVNFKNYVESIHPDTKNSKAIQSIKNSIENLKSDFKKAPIATTVTLPLRGVTNMLELVKTLKATWDNSFFGNQGIGTLLDPRTADIWVKSLVKSFGDIGTAMKGGNALDAIRAEVYSRPDAINGTYTREKLALGLRKEEALPSSLPEQFTPLSRLFKASSQAYSGAALRMRADIADRLNTIARKQRLDLTNKDLAEDIGRFTNAITGRGSLGAAEGALRSLNAIAFSPRLLAGAWQTLSTPFNLKVDPFVRVQATKKLASMIVTWYGMMQIIEALHPGSTDQDPRSAHFGQVKVDDKTWVNTIGPFRPLVRALAQTLPTQHEGEWAFWRRTANGKWERQRLFGTKPKFGSYTALDVAEGFFESKASPALGAYLNIARGQTFDGKPNTPETLARSLFIPITLDQLYSQYQDNVEFEKMIRDAVLNGTGFSAVEYTKKK